MIGAFRRNPNFEQEIKADPKYRAGMTSEAETVASRVREIAPRGPTGRYADSIVTGINGDDPFVATTDFAGHLVEWGSANNPPYAPLRRAVRAAGLRLTEQ